jgi:hypothetical protein
MHIDSAFGEFAINKLKSVITCGCEQDKVNNLITLSKLEHIFKITTKPIIEL